MNRELIDEMISELEAMERLVRRNFPGFVHPLIAKLRAEQSAQPAERKAGCTLCGHCAATGERIAAHRHPLTDEQVWLDDELMKLNTVMMLPMDYFMRVVRAIEAAHGIGSKA